MTAPKETAAAGETVAKPVYDKAYFIAKFEAIPEERWTTGVCRSGQHCCSLGHCGETSLHIMLAEYGAEARALIALFPPSPDGSLFGADGGVVEINDGWDLRYTQPTPRARILAALRDLP